MVGSGINPYFEKVNASDYRIWKGQEPILSSFDIELTERCNNNCIHCYINLPENDNAKRREMSTDEVKRVLAEAADLGALSVRFTGGEPLLRDDFPEIYLFARRLGLRVLIFTNARLITPEIADLFDKVPPLEKIEVTVYGMTRESYEAVSRVKGSYDQFRRGLDLLQDKKIPFVVKGAYLPSNRGEIELFEKWASTVPAMGKPPTYTVFFNLRCRRDSPEKNRLIERLRPAPEEGLSVLSRSVDRREYLEGMKQFCRRFLSLPGDRLFSCGAGQKVCVDAYGIVQPCMLLKHPDLVYDIREVSIKNALASFSLRLREIKARNPDYLGRCARCFLKGLCEQCPARSWMEHGNLDTPVDYLCQVAHGYALDLGLLKKGEKAWEVIDWEERIRAFVDS
jgi:radical SAM protein with 4Fe4S-binding SPASM domain